MTMTLTLNNGIQMPALGFGVFQTPPDVTAQAVRTALATGYRLIDTAAAYGNEREVGQAIRGSGLARDDVFIETKIWISDYGYDQTLHASDKSAGSYSAKDALGRRLARLRSGRHWMLRRPRPSRRWSTLRGPPRSR